jgi:uncharacterized protein (DUF58 family)
MNESHISQLDSQSSKAGRPGVPFRTPLNRRSLSRRLARLNHILIPDKSADRDRLRNTRWVKILGLSASLFFGFSREGRGLWYLAFPIGLASLNVRFAQVHLLFAFIIGALIASWLSRPFFRIKGLRTRVLGPRRVAAESTAVFQIELENTGALSLNRVRLVLPFLPWDGKWTGERQDVSELKPGERALIQAEARFRARGEHHLDPFSLGQLVPFGLSTGPLVPTDSLRFLVVPKIAKVERLQFPPSHSVSLGHRLQSNGNGEDDFSGVRPYRVGDPLRRIHAKTWARTGVPHIREFEDEKDSRVVVCLLTGQGTDEREHEALLSLVAGITARLTLHEGGLNTLLCNEAHFAIEPQVGSAALDLVLDRLATLPFKLEQDLREGTASLTIALGQATSAIFATAGDSRAFSSSILEAKTRGVSCLWLHVGEEEKTEHRRSDRQFVSCQSIEDLEVLRL